MLVLLLGRCTRQDPPAPPTSPSIALPDLVPALSTATVAPDPPATAAVDAAVLPQTLDLPDAASAAFGARVAALWSGIVQDEPERAMPFFFPLGAYEQVKDVANPAADWRHRLVAAYAHDVHLLHGRLGDDCGSGVAAAGDGGSRCRLVRLEVPSGAARWVERGEEYNKIGYYRVFGSKLRYEAGGQARTFDVKSLISWRGEWYVVHLSAIK